jgi:hypothetical protein
MRFPHQFRSIIKKGLHEKCEPFFRILMCRLRAMTGADAPRHVFTVIHGHCCPYTPTMPDDDSNGAGI